MKQITTTLVLMLFLTTSCGTIKSIWSNENAQFLAAEQLLTSTKKSLMVLINNDVITNENDLDNIVDHAKEADKYLEEWSLSIARGDSKAEKYQLLLNKSMTALVNINKKYNKKETKEDE